MRTLLLMMLALFSSVALAGLGGGSGIKSASLSGSVHSTSEAAVAEGEQLQAQFDQNGKQMLAKHVNYYSSELVDANSIRVIESNIDVKETKDEKGMEGFQPVLRVQYRYRVFAPWQRD